MMKSLRTLRTLSPLKIGGKNKVVEVSRERPQGFGVKTFGKIG